MSHRRAAGLLGLGLTGVLGWQGLRLASSAGEPGSSVPLGSTATMASAAPTPARPASVPGSAPSASAVLPSRGRIPAEGVEVCGIGRVRPR